MTESLTRLGKARRLHKLAFHLDKFLQTGMIRK